MNPTIQNRINALVQRRLTQPRASDEQSDGLAHERRLAREHLLSEIPLAKARLASAIDEVNDSVSEAAIHLKLEDASEHVTLEASFTVSMWPVGEEPATLDFNIIQSGKLVVLMSVGQERAPLMSADIWTADRNFFLDALVSFLERATE